MASAAAPTQRASFPLCGEGKRVTCVVDGDTVWLEGEKMRLRSINAPEKTDPACAREAEMAAKATARLRQILNGNAWRVTRHGKDKYGRTLAEFEIGGETAGAMLVAEGLAHEWNGARRSWCG